MEEKSALNVEIPTDLKNESKVAAAVSCITLKTFVINALRDKVKKVLDGEKK